MGSPLSPPLCDIYMRYPSKKISKIPLKNCDFFGILKVSAGILKENENYRFLRGDVKFI